MSIRSHASLGDKPKSNSGYKKRQLSEDSQNFQLQTPQQRYPREQSAKQQKQFLDGIYYYNSQH